MFLNHLSKQNLWLLAIALFLYNGQTIASSTNPEENECHQISIPSPNTLNEDDLAKLENETDAQKYVVRAQLGDAESQYLLAVCYFFGQRQVERNTIEAAFWARRSALSHYQNAHLLLEHLYSPGSIFCNTLDESFKIYLKLAGQNNVKAQIIVADCYLLGCSVKQSDVEAIEWYKKAADEGNPHAQIALGQLYLSKKVHVEKNIDPKTLAYNLFSQAAQKNNFRGVLKVAACLYNGIGVQQNREHAANCLSLYRLYRSIT